MSQREACVRGGEAPGAPVAAVVVVGGGGGWRVGRTQKWRGNPSEPFNCSHKWSLTNHWPFKGKCKWRFLQGTAALLPLVLLLLCQVSATGFLFDVLRVSAARQRTSPENLSTRRS